MREHQPYQCSMSLQCKSTECTHAKPHSPEHPHNCDKPAPCGCWPDNRDFQPRVVCIPVDQVKPRADCPNCGKKEGYGHHQHDCIAVLKRRVAELEAAAK